MGRNRDFMITESLSDLEGLKLQVKNYRSAQQLNALIVIQSGKYETLESVANHLEVHYSTLQRWLNRYKKEGITRLLAPLKRDKPSKIIPVEVQKEIEQRLRSKENPFSGYIEVQQWLLQEHEIEINYQWLWKFMRTRLDSRLKVPRKTNIKKQTEAEEAFFKTPGDTQLRLRTF